MRQLGSAITRTRTRSTASPARYSRSLACRLLFAILAWVSNFWTTAAHKVVLQEPRQWQVVANGHGAVRTDVVAAKVGANPVTNATMEGARRAAARLDS
eukprot:scaffold147867_cov27-Prasinocladus_malaysianus.AAC.1